MLCIKKDVGDDRTCEKDMVSDPLCSCHMDGTKIFPYYGPGATDGSFYCWRNKDDFGSAPALGTNAKTAC